jgi:sec-independent protein translocase protein TatA
MPKGNYTMFDIGPTELIIVLVIVLLLFGPGRLTKLMSELGEGIRSFKDSFSSEEKTDSVSDANINPK